ncbi:MAG: FAD-binding oxidoreductase [Rhodospirillales bacterium]|nr:FAD-binding oxidoreductase [Rhodospirillales bacterium]
MEPLRDVETDVLVVGGGLLGCAVAYYLARAGADVVLIERDELNTQASGANAGNLHSQIPHAFFTGEEEEYGDGRADLRAEMGRMRPLLLAAIEEWKDLARTMARDFGIDLEVAITGGLMVAETEAQMRVLEEKVIFERQFGLEAEIIKGNALRAFAPYIAEHMIGAEYCPSEGTANPLTAASALARDAEAAGARIFRHTTLAGLESAPRGFEAITSRGRIRAGKVFAAAGGWIDEVAAMVGVDIRTRRDPIQIIVTEPVGRTADHLIYFTGQRLTMKQTRSGNFVIGGAWPARWHDVTGLAVNLRSHVAYSAWVARRVVPELGHLRIIRSWAAGSPATARGTPVLGEAESVPGFFVGLFPYFGFTAGPLFGRMAADMISGRAPAFDPSPFALARHGGAN